MVQRTAEELAVLAGNLADAENTKSQAEGAVIMEEDLDQEQGDLEGSDSEEKEMGGSGNAPDVITV